MHGFFVCAFSFFCIVEEVEGGGVDDASLYVIFGDVGDGDAPVVSAS